MVFRQEKAAVLQENKVDYACRSRGSEESGGPYSEHVSLSIYIYISPFNVLGTPFFPIRVFILA